jgi:hypothetical protein
VPSPCFQKNHRSNALSTPASGMANRTANRTKVASISASVQRARVHFGVPCNKRAFILAIHLLSVFWRTIKERYASMLHKVWTVSRAPCVPRTHGMKCSSLIPLLKSVQFIESTRVFVG